MRVFVSELSRCLKVKTVYKLFFWTLFFVLVVVVPLVWILSYRPPKTKLDYVKEYLQCRMSFTPDTAKDAYYCPRQYKDPYYDARIEPVVKYIREKRIYQLFRPTQITAEGKRKWKVKGRLVRFSCPEEQGDNCLKILDKVVNIEVFEVKGKFGVSEEF